VAGKDDELLRLEGITRRFGSILANDRVDLEVRRGEIHALVGENGAGKSTLMRILYGLLRPDGGGIAIGGRRVNITSPAKALALGIGMMHQHFMLVPRMPVWQNIALGAPGCRGLRPLPKARILQALERLSRDYGLRVDPLAPVAGLSVGELQRVEILRLLYHGARILVCDEPTAVLAPPEVDSLFGILRRLRDEGRSVVFITHKLREVLAVADRVTVLRRGRVAGRLDRSEMDPERIVSLMMGTGPDGGADAAEAAEAAEEPREEGERPVPPAVEVLVARGLGLRGGGGWLLRSIDLSVRAGEIVGIAGVEGNGQAELAEVLAGRRRFDAGYLQVRKRRFRAGSVVPAWERPAFIPPDRTRDGLLEGMACWENLVLSWIPRARARSRPRGGAAGPPPLRFFYRASSLAAWAAGIMREFRVTPAEPRLSPGALSGGNQQKLLCAREAWSRPAVLVASQPTRGVDIASTRFLHGLLRSLKHSGSAVVLFSSDTEEVLGLSDRVAVMLGGRLIGPVERSCTDLERVGRAMVGLGEL